MKIKLFLFVSIMLASLITYGQKRTKKMDDKVTSEQRAKMTEEQRIVTGNQKKIKKKKKNLTTKDRVKAAKKENRRGRRMKRPN